MPLSYLAVFIVAFLASLLGPLCGIGGGVIIKPVVDAMNVMPGCHGLFSLEHLGAHDVACHANPECRGKDVDRQRSLYAPARPGICRWRRGGQARLQ